MIKHKDIIEQIESMSVLELHELVKALEEKFGVSAHAVATAPVTVAGVASGDSETEEKTSFNIELKSAGEQKINVIKVLKESLGIGLKEAKDFTDKVPSIIKEGVDKKTADELKKKLEGAGAIVELK